MGKRAILVEGMNGLLDYSNSFEYTLQAATPVSSTI
jgi:hypothetical protein